MPFRLRPSRRARARWACTAPVRVSSSPTGGGRNTGPARSRASGQPFRTLSRISRSRERSGAEQTPSVSNLVSPYRMCPASFSGISGFIDRADIIVPTRASALGPARSRASGQLISTFSLVMRARMTQIQENIGAFWVGEVYCLSPFPGTPTRILLFTPCYVECGLGRALSPHAMLACVCQRRAGA